jgi:hypothetical protein
MTRCPCADHLHSLLRGLGTIFSALGVLQRGARRCPGVCWCLHLATVGFPLPGASDGIFVGCREGYLFRSGTKGLGYYRKDVVRLYAPTRPRTFEPKDASAAGGSGGAAATATMGNPSGAAGPPQSEAAEVQPQRPPAAAAAKPAQQGNSSHMPYLQRLLRAAPGIPCAITTWDGSLLITGSLGSRDSCIRVWRLPQPPSEEPQNPCEDSQTQGKHENASSSPGDTTPPSSCSSESAPAATPTPAAQPTLLHTLAGHTAPVLSLVLNPEGTLLFSGSHDYTIHAWRTSDWACVRVLKGHGGGVRALAVSPDGGTLYSAAGDNTLRVRLPPCRAQLLLSCPAALAVGVLLRADCCWCWGQQLQLAVLTAPVHLKFHVQRVVASTASRRSPGF